MLLAFSRLERFVLVRIYYFNHFINVLHDSSHGQSVTAYHVLQFVLFLQQVSHEKQLHTEQVVVLVAAGVSLLTAGCSSDGEQAAACGNRPVQVEGSIVVGGGMSALLTERCFDGTLFDEDAATAGRSAAAVAGIV